MAIGSYSANSAFPAQNGIRVQFAGLALVVMGFGLIGGGLLAQLGIARPTAGEPAAAPAQAPMTYAPVAPQSTTWTPSPPPRERTGREEPTRTPASVTVQSGSAGSACTASARNSDWGDYPVAQCRTWKPSSGLVTGESLGTGTLTVTCQADLQESNPVYTAKQTNTWWFWAQANDGTWDWFPETALAQGASDQPVNGVALCR